MQPGTPQPINLFEYEPLAKARLEPSAYGYYASAAEVMFMRPPPRFARSRNVSFQPFCIAC
jgi:hypothetical protein